MSTRLQVVLDEAEVRRAARRRRQSVSEWVRGALRAARRAEPEPGEGRKLDVIRAATSHAFPTADIDQMLAEITQGRLERGA
jgi:hypothetical protein